MRFEYILVVGGVALAGLGGLTHLGGAWSDAIARDGHGSPRAPHAMIASAQAALDDVAEVASAVTRARGTAHVMAEGSAFRTLAPALQHEATDAAALQNHLDRARSHGLLPGNDRDFESLRVQLLRLSPSQRALEHADHGDVLGVANIIHAHPELTHMAGPEGTASLAAEALRKAGQAAVSRNLAPLRHDLAAAGSVVRGIRARMPTVSDAVAEHFFAWSTEWMQSGAKLTGAPGSPPINPAFTNLQKGYLPGYHRNISLVAHAPDRGFAIALADLPGAMTRWKSVTEPEAPSAVVRDVMGPNLAFLQDQAAVHIHTLRAEMTRWGDHLQGEHRAETERNLARAERWQTELAAAVASPALSKREVLRLFDGAPGFETTDAMGFMESRLKDHEWFFPVASDTPRYWSYGEVPAWHALGIYPLEMPRFAKEFDNAFSSPRAYAGHDFGHISAIRARRGDPVTMAKERSLAQRWTELRDQGASPELLRTVNDYLGEIIWEGDRGVGTFFQGRRNYSLAARREILRWYEDYFRAVGNEAGANQATEIYKELH